MSVLFSGALIGLGLLSSVELVVFVRIVMRERLWSENSTLIFVAGAGFLVPDAYGRITGSTFVVLGAYDQAITVSSGWVAALARFSIVAMLSVGCVLVVHQIFRQRNLRGNTPSIALVLAALCGVVGSFSSGAPLSSTRLLDQFVFLLVCVFSVRGRGGAAVGGAAVAISAALLAVLLYVLRPDQATSLCRFDKCGLLDGIYRGTFSNGNALGLTLAIGLPFIFLVGKQLPRHMWASIALVALSIVLTVSRTAIIGLLACAFSVAVLAAGSRRRDRATQLSSGVVVAAVAAGVLVEAGVAFFAPPGAFTDRAALWEWGRQEFRTSPWVGVGWNALERFFTLGGGIAGTSSYSLHNQFLDVLVIGGVSSLTFFIVAFISLIRAGLWDRRLLVLACTVVWVGVLETPWSIGQVDWLSWSMYAAVLLTQEVAESVRRKGLPTTLYSGGARRSSVQSTHAGSLL